MSRDNPQLEDGYLKVVNSVAEALARTQLSGYESRILWFLWRKTYGWGKKTDLIPLSQFVDGTGINKRHVINTISRLVKLGIIFKDGTEIRTRKPATYEFNKHFGEWKDVPKSVPVPNTVPESVPKLVPKSAPSIDRVLSIEKGLKSSLLPKPLDSTNYQGFEDAWISICVSAGLHGVRDWSTWHERIKGAWNRIAASKDSSWSVLSPLERICDLFTHAAKIPFLAGDNSRKWKADLEFVLRPLSIDRIMGGYYCDMVQSEPLKPIPVRTAEEDRLQRERGLAWLDPDKVKEEVKDER